VGLARLADRSGTARVVGRSRGRHRALRPRHAHGCDGGRLQELTWRFWDRYCEEAYCILSPDFLDGGQAPNGFDLEALRADLALVTA